MFDRVAKFALESLVCDEALYHGLKDNEGTLLLEWAEGRLRWVASECSSEIVARAAVEKELDRLRAAFKVISYAVGGLTECDRTTVVCVTMRVLSEVWLR